MTTNQTIDGVPRELVERITNPFGDVHDKFNAIQELRALLDTPAVERKPFGWWRVPPGRPLQGMFLSYVGPETEAPIKNALDSGFTVIRLYDHPAPAAQHQGEPAGFRYRANGGPWEWMDESPFADGRTHHRENGEELQPLHTK